MDRRAILHRPPLGRPALLTGPSKHSQRSSSFERRENNHPPGPITGAIRNRPKGGDYDPNQCYRDYDPNQC